MSSKQGAQTARGHGWALAAAGFAAGLMVLVAGLGSATVRAGQQPGGVVSPVAVVAADTVAVDAEPCMEDEPCFNPCTMGVNGLYPETDPRYYVPGPCDLSTKLPGDRFLVVEISGPGAVRPPVDVACDAGEYWAVVSVLVRNPDGSDVADSRVRRTTCVPAFPDQLRGEVGGALPGMFREAARHA